MKIYLVQHGKALSEEIEKRKPLSKIGKLETEGIASHLKKQGIVVNKVYHSGKLRAKETADIFSKYLCDGTIHQIQGINPNDDVKEFIQKINDEDLMFVGHLPFMEKAVSLLVANDKTAQVLKFKNSSVVCIEKDEDNYCISWYLIPKICSNYN